MLYFNEFILEQDILESNFELFKHLCLSLDEKFLVETLNISDFDSLNEATLLDKLKTRLESAKETLKERGKNALTDVQQKIISLGGAIKGIVLSIVQKVKQWISKFVNIQKAKAKQFVSAANKELNEKVSKIKDKKKLIDESKHLRQMASAFLSWINSGLFKSFESSANKAASTIDINESLMILEGETIPYSHKLLHLVHKVPPFSMIGQIEEKAGKFSGYALSRASYKISELTGSINPIEFVVIPGLIGLIIGYKVEHLAKEGIIELFPGIGTICSIISTVSLALAIIEAIELTNKDKEDESGSENSH